MDLIMALGIIMATAIYLAIGGVVLAKAAEKKVISLSDDIILAILMVILWPWAITHIKQW